MISKKPQMFPAAYIAVGSPHIYCPQAASRAGRIQHSSWGPKIIIYSRTFILPIHDMKTFNVPITYRSPLITALKNRRREEDKMKKDFMPALLELGDLNIYLARHFGFCYG